MRQEKGQRKASVRLHEESYIGPNIRYFFQRSEPTFVTLVDITLFATYNAPNLSDRQNHCDHHGEAVYSQRL